MTEFFKTLEQEYHIHINKANKQLLEITNSSADVKDHLFQETRNEIRSVEDLVSELDKQASLQTDKKRKELGQKIKIYKEDYEDIKKKFLKIECDFIDKKEKAKLLGDLEKGKKETLSSNKFESEAQESMLEKQNKKLKGAIQQGYEIITVANDTKLNLEMQTETLKKGKERLINMNSDLGESNSLIKQMQNKISENKMRMYTVMGFVGVSVLVIFCSYIL